MYTKIIVTLFLLIGIYGAYHIFQNKINESQRHTQIIDSLNHEITLLDSINAKKDSTIIIYKDSIIYLDNIIYIKKNEITKIKEKYDKIHSSIIKYTNHQLDSFFTNRYKY